MAVYEGKNVGALYEEWETKEHQEAYAAWRMEKGHDLIEPHIDTFQATYAEVLNTYWISASWKALQQKAD